MERRQRDSSRQMRTEEMDWKYLFASFSGRIGRKQFWIGTIVTIVLTLILSFALLPIAGIDMIPSFDPSAGPDAMINAMRKAAFGQFIILAIIFYPTTALMKKRLNDRDRPDWFIYAFWAPTGIQLLLDVAGLGYTTTDMGDMTMPMPSSVSLVVLLASMVIGLWSLVELGILRGTQGPNQHGPDPVAG